MPGHLANSFENYFPTPRDELIRRLESGDAALDQEMRGSLSQHSKDDVIFVEGQSQKFVYRLASGLMARSRLLEDGRRQIISIFTPGDLLSVKAMLLDRQADSIVCLSSCTVRALDYTAAIALAASNSDVGFRFMWQLAEDERRLHNHVTMLGRGNAIERIAAMLIDITGRHIKLSLKSSAPAYLVIRQQDIADYVGLTVVHVNRVLRNLREQKAIRVEAGKITIADREAMSRHAGPMLDVFEREAPEFNGGGI